MLHGNEQYVMFNYSIRQIVSVVVSVDNKATVLCFLVSQDTGLLLSTVKYPDPVYDRRSFGQLAQSESTKRF